MVAGMASIRTIVVDDEKPARMRLLELLRLRFDVQVVGLQDFKQFAQVLNDQIRLGRPQIVERVVAREHRA